MRVVLALLGLLCSTMYAYSYNDVLRDYEAKNFEKVCTDGSIFYMKNDKNENWEPNGSQFIICNQLVLHQ